MTSPFGSGKVSKQVACLHGVRFKSTCKLLQGTTGLYGAQVRPPSRVCARCRRLTDPLDLSTCPQCNNASCSRGIPRIGAELFALESQSSRSQRISSNECSQTMTSHKHWYSSPNSCTLQPSLNCSIVHTNAGLANRLQEMESGDLNHLSTSRVPIQRKKCLQQSMHGLNDDFKTVVAALPLLPVACSFLGAKSIPCPACACGCRKNQCIEECILLLLGNLIQEVCDLKAFNASTLLAKIPNAHCLELIVRRLPRHPLNLSEHKGDRSPFSE